jgi:hypothetical protein
MFQGNLFPNSMDEQNEMLSALCDFHPQRTPFRICRKSAQSRELQ